MPVPTPRSGESKDEFVSRCMGDSAMQEYDQKQRAAVCYNAWSDKGSKKANSRNTMATLSVGTDMVRKATLDGREYLVAPVVPIVEGVHNGEFVSYKELTVFPDAWDGRPLPIDHPTKDGQPITANSPDVMEHSVVGFLFNVVARPDIRGISGELWVDIEKAKTVPGGQEVLNKLNGEGTLEVSTAYNTFIEDDPGEFTNPVTGEVETYTKIQMGLRPDHLALLPFHVGACNWADGCGAPRVNHDHTSESKGSTMPEKLKVTNGAQLTNVMTRAIATAQDEAGEGGMIGRLATAAGISTDTMQQIVDGKMDFIPRRWINIFCAILDIDCYDLMMASSNDNIDARYTPPANPTPAPAPAEYSGTTDSSGTITITPVMSDNAQVPAPVKEKIVDPVAHVDNEDMSQATNTSTEPCECKEKTFGVKVQEIVTNTLKSLGIVKNDTQTEQENSTMANKVKVDALIASDKTRFAENDREFLNGLTDEQLALLEPVVEAAPVAVAAPATNSAPAATEVKVETVKVNMTKAEMLEALGMTEADIASLKANGDKAKADRTKVINEIKAVEGQPYDDQELAGMSDGTLQKVLTSLTPEDTPFRARGTARATNSDDEVPASPAIMLAAPSREGK